MAPARDELGYTNVFHRFLGEYVIRPIVGDEILINATDSEILVGTVLACAAAPLAVYFAPAAMSASCAFKMAVLGSALVGGGLDLLAQIDAGGDINWWSVGKSAVLGGLTGAACYVGLPYLTAALPCVVTKSIAVGLILHSGYSGVNNILEGNYFTGTAELIFAVTGVTALRNFSCFVLGTQVVRHAAALELASRGRTTEDVSSAWNPELLGLAAGTFFAGLLIAPDAAERRRRREEEAKRARHLMFDRAEDADPWQDDWDDVAEDTAVPDTSPPDRWQSEIDSLCDALFNGRIEEPAIDAGFEDEIEPCFDPGFEPEFEPLLEPAAQGLLPAAMSLELETAVAVKEPPVRLEPERSAATLPRRAPIRPKSKSTRRVLRWLAMAACFLLSGLFLFKASPPDLVSPDDPSLSHTAVVPTESRQEYVTSNIEDLKKGDLVLAKDGKTGRVEERRVVDVFRRTTDHLRILEFRDGNGAAQRLKTTDEHPFWVVAEEDFVAAGELQVGSEFVGPGGELQTLTATRREEHPEGLPVYNFEVEAAHTYFVSAHGLRAPPVLVHNACRNPFGRPGKPAHRARISQAEQRLKAKGWDTTAGGWSLKERKFGNRFPDLVMEKGGRKIAVQVGLATKKGRIPIARERRAISDLRALDDFDHVFFLEY